MNNKVKQYLDKLPSPQAEICIKVRQLLLKTLPSLVEEFKNGVPWYGKFYIVGLKDSVNVGFSIIGLDDEDMHYFKGKGKFMRHIKLHSLQDIDEDKLKTLFKLVMEKSRCYESDK